MTLPIGGCKYIILNHFWIFIKRVINSMRLILLALLFLTLSTHASFVEEIQPEDLSQIKSSSKIWLVYSPTDESDENIRTLHDVSLVLSGFFKIGILPPGDGRIHLYTDKGETEVYSGKIDVDQLVEFALSKTEAVIKSRSLVADQAKAYNEFKEKETERANTEWKNEQALRVKSNTFVVTPENWDSGFLKQRDPFFLNIYESNCSACIELNSIWEVVSTELKGKAIVAKINITDSHQLQENFKLENYPTIRFYPAGVKNLEDYVEFEGNFKRFAIMEWVNGRLKEQSKASIPSLTKQNYNSLCKESKATCVILFSDNLDQILAKTEELQAKYLKKPISFLIAKKGEQAEFESQAGIQSWPSTLMMYCKGKKLLRLDGMDFAQIDDIINEITLGNRNGFSKYKFEEKLI